MADSVSLICSNREIFSSGASGFDDLTGSHEFPLCVQDRGVTEPRHALERLATDLDVPRPRFRWAEPLDLRVDRIEHDRCARFDPERHGRCAVGLRTKATHVATQHASQGE